MSMKDLKAILHGHGLDARGCLEKRDFQLLLKKHVERTGAGGGTGGAAAGASGEHPAKQMLLQLNTMSLKALKTELGTRRKDYRHCIEKREFREMLRAALVEELTGQKLDAAELAEATAPAEAADDDHETEQQEEVVDDDDEEDDEQDGAGGSVGGGMTASALFAGVTDAEVARRASMDLDELMALQEKEMEAAFAMLLAPLRL